MLIEMIRMESTGPNWGPSLPDTSDLWPLAWTRLARAQESLWKGTTDPNAKGLIQTINGAIIIA
jgi:hypothetical protein